MHTVGVSIKIWQIIQEVGKKMWDAVKGVSGSFKI